MRELYITVIQTKIVKKRVYTKFDAKVLPFLHIFGHLKMVTPTQLWAKSYDVERLF